MGQSDTGKQLWEDYHADYWYSIKIMVKGIIHLASTQTFWKTNISYGHVNVSFSKNFAHVMNEWSQSIFY